MVPKACNIGGDRDCRALGVSHPAVLLVLAGAASAAVTWGAVGMLIPMLRSRIMDEPNERSSHSVPIPRGGGLGVMAGVAAGVAAGHWGGLGGGPLWYWVSVAVAAGMGLADDLRGGISPRLRLAGQIALAVVVVVAWSGPLARLPLPSPFDLQTGLLGYMVAVIWIVGVINIYNFLDGIDGYAAIQAIVAGLGAALLLGGPTASLGVCVAGAAVGFLFYNWHPAQVFLGDVGSSFLGATFALLPFLVSGPERPKAVFNMAMCLWLFLADGTLTLVLRAARKEKLLVSHRAHLYQRLVQTGLSHSDVVLGVLPLMVVMMISSLFVCGPSWAQNTGTQAWLVLFLGCAILTGLWLMTVHLEARKAG